MTTFENLSAYATKQSNTITALRAEIEGLQEQLSTLTARLDAVTGERDDAYKALTVIGEQRDAMKAMRDELLRDEYKLVQERDAARTSSETWKRCAKGWQQSSRHNGDELERVAKITRQQHTELTTLRAQGQAVRDAAQEKATQIEMLFKNIKSAQELSHSWATKYYELRAALAPGGGVGEGETE